MYYEFQAGNNWRTAPVTNITEHIIQRSQRRYNVAAPLPEVAERDAGACKLQKKGYRNS